MDCVCAWFINHEMAHADLGTRHSRVNHGPKYQKRMLKLALDGGFDKIW